MKQRIVAFILVLGIVLGMGVEGTEARAAEPEPTPPSQEKTITSIEVVDTDVEIPYKSVFTKNNVAIKVTYSDKSELITHPDQEIQLDTTKLGDQTFEVSYQGVKTEYIIRVVPRQVTGLKLKDATKKKATIEWSSLTEADEYEIYTSTKETGSFTLLKSTTKTTYEFTDLEGGKLLYVKIRAVSGEYAGADSATIVVALQPEQVTGIKAVQNVKTKITLTWDKTEGATGYQIYYRLSIFF